MKLPGTTADKPNVYPFDTPYEVIYQDLCSKDKKAYTQNGVLNMLDRNRRIKRNPEKFQQNKDCFDIILSCEGTHTSTLLTSESVLTTTMLATLSPRH